MELDEIQTHPNGWHSNVEKIKIKGIEVDMRFIDEIETLSEDDFKKELMRDVNSDISEKMRVLIDKDLFQKFLEGSFENHDNHRDVIRDSAKRSAERLKERFQPEFVKVPKTTTRSGINNKFSQHRNY